MMRGGVLIPATESGRYSVVISDDPGEIEAAQRLRYLTFAEELGAALPHAVRGRRTGEMIDVDQFDEHSDHLLAREESTGQIVGCYRLLPPDGARAAGGVFTDTIFEVSPGIDALRPSLVELGRASVHPDHRNGAVMGMLWAGILRYQELTGYLWAIGCLSVRMEAGGPRGALVRGVLDEAYRAHPAPAQFRVVPRNPLRVNGLSLAEMPSPGRVRVPPMVAGSLRIGGVICGEPSYDPDFDMADFVVLINRDMVRGRYLERLSRTHVPA
ncbi:GNAT family N-acetyltransferase [Mycolicibacterium cosmeticum]|uniref:Hemolysin n=1 Tax=Mycolicibacterium cosmeticum TaxID=258533 RepID=W9ALK5_MYCCO|nr:GNAT family N-acyltransferase [Mycolicibacterium cosmeticum]TLH69357.1 GNAT family N-acetyltransferase [Mycolicibacterium cosmeticum]CDO06574.1 putative hemolysin [Mycolicibacterium cosmeticum]